MGKFVFKYTIIFFSFISILFFSLIGFNSLEANNMEPAMELAGEMSPPPPPPIYIPMIFILIVSFVFIFLILKYIAKNFVEPLTIIENNVKKIKDGFLDVEFETKSENKEIQETYKTLNDMALSLKEKEKLHDNFIQNIVHDLRAPVVAQERAMEILSEEFKDNSLVQGLASNNDSFLKMINEIIEAISQKEVKIEKSHFNICKLANSVIEALEPSYKAKNIKIINEIDENLTVFADYLSSNRIIANLISNAIENIEEGKTIKLSAKKDKEKTAIVVEDNGAGIKDIENIFKKYSSTTKSSKKTVSGLGLAIVAELVQKNNGKISVKSELDNYTKFIIELPNE